MSSPSRILLVADLDSVFRIPLCHLQDVPIMIGDISDTESLDRIVSRARVVLSAAGPFALVGTPMVDACVRNGSHYCDITGELTLLPLI